MALIAARELHDRTTELLRRVREDRDEFIVTDQGQPVARLGPLAPESDRASGEIADTSRGWQTYARLAATLRQQWPARPRTRDILDEIRR